MVITPSATASSNTGNESVSVTTAVTSGNVTVNSLRFNNTSAATFTFGTGSSNIISSGGLLFGSGSTAAETLTGGTITSGNGELDVIAFSSMTPALNSAIANNGSTALTLVKSGTTNLNLGGVLSFTGGFDINTSFVTSTGTTNTYSGQTIVAAGAALGTTSTSGTVFGASGVGNEIVVQNGAYVRLQNYTGTLAKNFIVNGSGQGNGVIQFYSGSGGTVSGTVQLAGDSMFAIRPNAALTNTISGVISDQVSGANNNAVFTNATQTNAFLDTFVLSAQNTYGGNTLVTDNTTSTGTINFSLQLTNTTGNTLPSTTVVTLGGTGSFNGVPVGATAGAGRLVLGSGTNAASQTIAGLTTGGTSTFNAVVGGASGTASTLTINNALNYTYGGFLGSGTAGTTTANNLAFTKSGTGTMTLSAASTYTGATTVNGGTLAVSGSINSSNTVNVTAGALTLSNAIAAVLSDYSTLTLLSGTTLNLNANASTSEVIAALFLNTTSVPAGTYSASDLNGTYGAGGYNFTSLNGETLTIGAVPEPTTILSSLLLVAALGWHLRSRRRQVA